MPSPRRTLEPPTYTFRVRLLGGLYARPRARQIWREIELAGNQTLAALGEAIPAAFDFDDPHLWAFFLSGQPWDRATEYRLEPEPSLTEEVLGELFGERPPAKPAERLPIREAPAGREFRYIFDFGDEWHFGVKLARTDGTLAARARYPRIVARHGASPPQYPNLEAEAGDEGSAEADLD